MLLRWLKVSAIVCSRDVAFPEAARQYDSSFAVPTLTWNYTRVLGDDCSNGTSYRSSRTTHPCSSTASLAIRLLLLPIILTMATRLLAESNITAESRWCCVHYTLSRSRFLESVTRQQLRRLECSHGNKTIRNWKHTKAPEITVVFSI